MTVLLTQDIKGGLLTWHGCMQKLTEEQLRELMERIESHGREASEQLAEVFDEAEGPTPSRSQTSRKGRPTSSAMTSTAKTGRRKPAASKAVSPADSVESDAGQVCTALP